jgi:hypothetical protein
MHEDYIYTCYLFYLRSLSDPTRGKLYACLTYYVKRYLINSRLAILVWNSIFYTKEQAISFCI